MDDDQQQMCQEPSVWDTPAPAPAPEPAPAPAGPDPGVEWCHRTADLPVLGPLGVEHWWLKDGALEGGMGGGDDDRWLGTQMTNHSGQSQDPGVVCEPVTDLNPAYADVDRGCVDNEITAGRYTGRWSPWNNCHTEVRAVLDGCTPPESFADSSGGASGSGSGGAGPASGEGGAGPQ